MQVQRSLVAGRDDHGAEREMTGLDDLGIIVLAGPTTADVAHLSTPVLGIDLRLKSKHIPVRLPIFKAGHVIVDLIDSGSRIVHSMLRCRISNSQLSCYNQPLSGSPVMASR